MGSLAENIVIPIRPDLRAVEQRVADLDDGYTRLATTLLEEIAGADLTKRQLKVLLAVVRLTYGWNKSRDRISNSQIAEVAKLPIKRVSETRVQLVQMNVLKQTGNQIGPNKNITEWGIPQSEGESPKLRDEKSPKLRESHPSKQGDTIDIIQKTKENLSSSRNSDEFQDTRTETFLDKHPEAIGGCFTPSGKSWGTADDLECARWIYAKALVVNPTLKEPNWPEWSNEVRLLRTGREQTHKQICRVFKWANCHHFWSANVLSPGKLRKQWDTLSTQMAQPVSPPRQKSDDLDWNNRDWADSLPPGVL